GGAAGGGVGARPRGAGHDLRRGGRRGQRMAVFGCRRPRAAGICRARRVRVLDAISSSFSTRCGAKAPSAVFSQNCHFRWGRSGSSAQLWLTLTVSAQKGTTAKGGTAGGWSLRMLWGARGRPAMARAAQSAAVSVPAAVALGAASLAADPAASGRQTEPAASGRQTEPAASGRQTEPAANGRQTEPAANGRQAEPAPNGRLVGNGAGAGTMDHALIQSHQNTPPLTAHHSATRAIDENVPTALAGYRPRVSGTASLTDQYLDQLTRTTGTTAGIPATYTQAKGSIAVQSYGLTATQTLYNGFQTATRTRQAEGQVFSA